MIVSYYIIYTNHFHRPGIKATICKIYDFSIITSICSKYYCAQGGCAKTVGGKFSFSELRIEKVKFSTQSLTKIFYISVFNVGGCVASCLTFRPFLTLGPYQLGCSLKKTCG